MSFPPPNNDGGDAPVPQRTLRPLPSQSQTFTCVSADDDELFATEPVETVARLGAPVPKEKKPKAKAEKDPTAKAAKAPTAGANSKKLPGKPGGATVPTPKHLHSQSALPQQQLLGRARALGRLDVDAVLQATADDDDDDDNALADATICEQLLRADSEDDAGSSNDDADGGIDVAKLLLGNVTSESLVAPPSTGAGATQKSQAAPATSFTGVSSLSLAASTPALLPTSLPAPPMPRRGPAGEAGTASAAVAAAERGVRPGARGSVAAPVTVKAEADATRPSGAAATNYVVPQHESDTAEGIAEHMATANESSNVADGASTEALGVADAGGKSNDEQLIFYWFDAKELPSEPSERGTVFLFGKMRQQGAAGGGFVSCCLRVRGIDRCVYFLPKPGVPVEKSIPDIFALCAAHRIPKAEARVKVVERWYAFEEPGVPHGCHTWLKLRYPAKYSALPFGGGSSGGGAGVVPPWAAAVFGANRSATELLLVNWRLKGPSYLVVKKPSLVTDLGSRITHCVKEFGVASPTAITVADDAVAVAAAGYGALRCGPPPPLVAMSLNLVCQLDASGKHNEVLGATVIVCNNVAVDGGQRTVPAGTTRYTAVRQWNESTPFPLELRGHCERRGLHSTRTGTTLHTFANETLLLKWLVMLFRQHDPDLLVGHSFASYTLDVLLHRLAELRCTSEWSLVGRFRLHSLPKLQSGAGGRGEATFEEKEVCAGRLIVDTYLLSREHYKSSNYKLLSLAASMGLDGLTGKITEAHLSEPTGQAATMDAAFFGRGGGVGLCDVLLRSLNASYLALAVAHHLDVVPLTKTLSQLSGQLWGRSLVGGSRAERIEYLLLHAFHEVKYVTPDKKSYAEQHIANSRKAAREADVDADAGDEEGMDGGGGAGNDAADEAGGAFARRKAKYKGGLVLAPKIGLYNEYVLLLDFNSLYPSLIQEYNICFTTVKRGGGTGAADPSASLPSAADLVCDHCRRKVSSVQVIGMPGVSVKQEQSTADAGAAFSSGSSSSSSFSDTCRHKCILPKQLHFLVESRRQVKQLMAKAKKDSAEYAQYDIRQKAIKLTANSMYGCLGYEHSRFYAQQLAELVTMEGRNALGKTVELIPRVSQQLEVIYGDTDSVMIRTGLSDDLAKALTFARDIQTEVNKSYKRLEIGIDGVFRAILLLRKKKYACITVEDFAGAGTHLKREVKGLDMVRRDWCPLSKDASDHVLDALLASKQQASSDDVVEFVCAHMADLASRCRAGAVPLAKYIISKSLTKEPELYRGGGFAHAAVALAMRARNEQVRVGDIIPYIVCEAVGANNNNNGGEEGGAANNNNHTSHNNSGGLASRCFHPDDVVKHGRRVDVEWYLENQVVPPVDRMCVCLQGFSRAQLSDRMALRTRLTDAAVGGGASAMANADAAATAYRSAFNLPAMDDVDAAYPLAEPLQIRCVACNRMTLLQPHAVCKALAGVGDGAPPKEHADDLKYSRETSEFRRWVFRCTECGKHVALAAVSNAVQNHCRRAIRSFYASGGTAAARDRCRAQVFYFRTLFDVPRFPGTDATLRAVHQEVLRAEDENGKACSLREMDAIRAANPEADLFNLPLELTRQLYNRFDQAYLHNVQTILP